MAWSGHSLLIVSSKVGSFGSRLASLRLHLHQLSPFEIYEENAVDGLVRGMATQPAQNMDASFSKEVRGAAFMKHQRGILLPFPPSYRGVGYLGVQLPSLKSQQRLL